PRRCREGIDLRFGGRHKIRPTGRVLLQPDQPFHRVNRGTSLNYSPIAFNTASREGCARMGSNPALLIAVSGSFRPWPVIVAVTTLPAGIVRLSTHFFRPANGAAQAGSTKSPSVRAMSL